MSSARVSVQSSSERVRMTEACRQCCLCSLSSAPLPRGPSCLMVRASGWYSEGLEFEAQLDHLQ